MPLSLTSCTFVAQEGARAIFNVGVDGPAIADVEIAEIYSRDSAGNNDVLQNVSVYTVIKTGTNIHVDGLSSGDYNVYFAAPNYTTSDAVAITLVPALATPDVYATPDSGSVGLEWGLVQDAESYTITVSLNLPSTSSAGTAGTVASIGSSLSAGAAGNAVVVSGGTGTISTTLTVPDPITTTDTAYTISGLTGGTSYLFSVVATPSTSTILPSAAGTVTATPLIPLRVGDIVATVFTDNAVQLSWAQVTNAGSYLITEVNSAIDSISVPSSPDENTCHRIIEGLTPAATYNFRITAQAASSAYAPTMFATKEVTVTGGVARFTQSARLFRIQRSASSVSLGFMDIATDASIVDPEEGTATYTLKKYNSLTRAFEAITPAPTVEKNDAYRMYKGLSPTTRYEFTAVFIDRPPIVVRLTTVAATIYPSNLKYALDTGVVTPHATNTSVSVGFTIDANFQNERDILLYDNMRFWRVVVSWYNKVGQLVASRWTYARYGDDMNTSITISAPNITAGAYKFKWALQTPDGISGPTLDSSNDDLYIIGLPTATDITEAASILTAVVDRPITLYKWEKSSNNGTTFTVIPGQSGPTLDVTAGYTVGDIIKVTPISGSVEGFFHTYIYGYVSDGNLPRFLSNRQAQLAFSMAPDEKKLDVLDKLTSQQRASISASAFSNFTAEQAGRMKNISDLTAEQFGNVPTGIFKQIRGELFGNIPDDLLSGMLGSETLSKASPGQLGRIQVASLERVTSNLPPGQRAVLASQFMSKTNDSTLFKDKKYIASFVGGFRSDLALVPAETTATDEDIGTNKLVKTSALVKIIASGATAPKSTIDIFEGLIYSSGPATISSADGTKTIVTGTGTTSSGTVEPTVNGVYVGVPKMALSQFGPVTGLITKSHIIVPVNAPFINIVGSTTTSVTLDVKLNQLLDMTGATLKLNAVKGTISTSYPYVIGTIYSNITYTRNPSTNIIDGMIINQTLASGVYSFAAALVGTVSNPATETPITGPVSVTTREFNVGTTTLTAVPAVTVSGGAGSISISGMDANTNYKIDVIKLNGTLMTNYFAHNITSYALLVAAEGAYIVRVVGGVTTLSMPFSQTVTVTAATTPTTQSGAVCFLGDAPVLTARGYRPIREFRVGDLVMTADGREVAVTRVFNRRYGPSAAVNPYVIPKGVLGAVRPVAISPDHEVLVPGRGMVRARDLGLRRMKMSEEFTYYNLELEDWVRDNLVVAGVTVESLAPAARITMTAAEFVAFVSKRYGPDAAARLRSVCFKEADGRISMPAFR
jgi:hypothetical protein